MAREDMIRKDMELVGTYNEIFEPTIKQLAKTERELSRAEKEWKKQGGQRICTMVNKTGAEYTAKSPYWTAVEDLRATVQSLRNQLGLTPTGLNKARSKLQPAAAGNSKIEQLLAAAHDHAVEQGAQYQRDVDTFVESVLSGESGLCEDVVLSCKRYVADLGSGKWDFRAEPANDIIAIIETMFCHQQGEFLDATPLRGTPFLLLPYHKFIVYNLMGFYLPDTKIRRFKEAVDFIPRKNVKTTFAASLAGALAMYERASGSKVYEVGGALKQALEGFDFLKYNFNRLGVTVRDDPNQGLRIVDNNMERSISGDIGDGMISINALAANPDKQDSFNCNIVIADEAHTYRRHDMGKEYYIEQLKEQLHEIMKRQVTLGRAEEITVYADAICALRKMGSHEDGEDTEFTREDAEKWVSHMENEDGTNGAHWTMEQTDAVANITGVSVKSCVWWAAMNMMYSDYYGVAAKYGLDRPEFYADLAKAFLMDKDAGGPEEKMAGYYHGVVLRNS